MLRAMEQMTRYIVSAQATKSTVKKVAASVKMVPDETDEETGRARPAREPRTGSYEAMVRALGGSEQDLIPFPGEE